MSESFYLDNKSITDEITTYENKPKLYQLQTEFPFNELTDRQFEMIVYSIFKEEIESNAIKNFDNINIMQGISERGRDCVLFNNNTIAGVIQTKKYSKRIDKPTVAREVIKFILFYLNDHSLIPDINNFKYYFVSSFDFSENALNLLSNSKSIIIEENFKNWVNEVIENYESFKSIKYETIETELKNILSLLTIIKINQLDLSLKLNKFEKIIKYFFSPKYILDVDAFSKLIDEKFNNYNLRELTDKDIKRLNKKIGSIPPDYRSNFGFVNFFGYSRKFLNHEESPKIVENILRKIAVLQSEIFKIIADEINNRMHELVIRKITPLKNISNFTKQAAAPYIISILFQQVIENNTPNFIVKLFKKEHVIYQRGTIDSIKKYLLETGERHLKKDFSMFDSTPDLKKLKINISYHVHSEFNSVQEMEERFDKDIITIKPILDEIITELSYLVPKSPTIIIEDSKFLDDVNYVNEIFQNIK